MVFGNNNIDQPIKTDDCSLENVTQEHQQRHETTYIGNDCVQHSAIWMWTWTYNKVIRDKLLAFEMYCYRKILRISWTEQKTNHKICDKLVTEKDLQQRAIGRKLRLFGHIYRMENVRSRCIGLRTCVYCGCWPPSLMADGPVGVTNNRARCRDSDDSRVAGRLRETGVWARR